MAHKASILNLEAIIATVRGQFKEALQLARSSLAYADVLGIGHVSPEWALAVRAAFELGDIAAVRELLALLDSHQPGHLSPDLRAQRDLARARLAGHDGDPAAGAAFAAAITSLREHDTPHELATGLLDQAGYLKHTGHAQAASAAIAEAREIAGRLRCEPLLDRAKAIEHEKPRVRA